MARFPDEPAFGPVPAANAETVEAPHEIAVQELNGAGALEAARADGEYLVRTKVLRDALAAEAEPDGLQAKYEPLFRQAYEGSATLVSDPGRRNLWTQSRAGDLDGHLLAAADRARSLGRERELAGVALQLDAVHDAALATDDQEQRAAFIMAANRLISSLQVAGHIDETAAKQRQKAWAENFALAAFAKLPAAEQIKWLEGDPQGKAASKGDVVDFVPQERREPLLQIAQTNLHEQEQLASSTVTLDRHKIETEIKEDLAAIAKSGKSPSSLSVKKVEAGLGSDAARKWKEDREDEWMVWKSASDLYALTDQQIEDRLRSLAPDENELADVRKARVYYAVQERANRIADLRLSDPAQSVEDDPVVRAMQEGQAQSYDPQSARDLYAARLAAQTRAGIAADAQSPITKDEALALTAPLQKEFADPNDRARTWEAVAKDVRNKVGPDADAALSYAREVYVVDAALRYVARVLSPNDRPVAPATDERPAEMSAAEKSLGLEVRELLEQPQQWPSDLTTKGPKEKPGNHILRAYTLRPNDKAVVLPQESVQVGDGNTYLPIPRKAIEMLRANPELLAEFNRKYDRRERVKDADRKPNVFDAFDGEWDAKDPDLQERLELNFANSFFRHTIAGAATFEVMKSNFPETYHYYVAVLARYDLMRPAASPMEMGAAFAGALAGETFTPETLIPGYKVGGVLAKRIIVGVFQEASQKVLFDTLIQQSNIDTGVQERFDEDRTTKEVLREGAKKAGKITANPIVKKVTPRRHHWMVDLAL